MDSKHAKRKREEKKNNKKKITLRTYKFIKGLF